MQDPVTGALVGAGVKREVTVPISDFSNRRLIYAYNSEKGTLIAITSTGNETCTGQGEQTRVDAFKGWIDPRIKK